MKLVASLVVRNEADRYLRECLDHLNAFCDEIRVLDDGSTDGSGDECVNAGAFVTRNELSSFFAHEGRVRQQLLEWTMEGHPTHIVALDADEFVADGPAVRDALYDENRTGVWKLRMSEVWQADQSFLYMRTDGAWGPRPVGIVYAVPGDINSNRVYRRHWRMPDKALACGRTPIYITQAGNRTITEPVSDILHFGWTCEVDRAARHARYVEHDGGQHHASRHLDSIIWDDERVQNAISCRWPESLAKFRDSILYRANRR